MYRIESFIAVALTLIYGGFLLGIQTHYDQLEIGQAIIVHSGEVFTPESWDAAVTGSEYAVVGTHIQRKWPWDGKKVQLIDGTTLLSDPKLGSLKVQETLRFGEGTFMIPDTINISGDIIGCGSGRTILIRKPK